MDLKGSRVNSPLIYGNGDAQLIKDVVYDGTGFPIIVPPYRGTVKNENWDNFGVTGNNAWTEYSPNTGALGLLSPTFDGTGNNGVISATVSAVGDIAGFHDVNNRWAPGMGTSYFEYRLKFSVLSDITDGYQCIIGFADIPRTEATTHVNYGAYFLYDEATNGDFMAVVTDGGATETTYVMDGGGDPARTTAAVAADTYIKLKVVISNANDEAYYYVNDVLKHTETIDTPTADAEPAAVMCHMNKLVGSGASKYVIDYVRTAMIYDTAV